MSLLTRNTCFYRGGSHNGAVLFEPAKGEHPGSNRPVRYSFCRERARTPISPARVAVPDRSHRTLPIFLCGEERGGWECPQRARKPWEMLPPVVVLLIIGHG